MNVYVDQPLCTGGGLCETTAPDLFVLDDHGVATVKAGGVEVPGGGMDAGGVAVPEELEAAVRDAAAVCPGACIICLEL